MADLTGIAPALAEALSDRGYDTLTAVQLAVLDEGVAGRDLLVSAQTGSGKTVAFGLAIAPDLLAGAERLEPATAPLALVVAPTRELALQVRREFEWLYAGAGAELASCVGGMDYRTERRALARGAHIVVGTPGRLRDHISRGSLDLSAVRAVVLDEADEMLDLGFREDLEFILGSAPEERRALMFSATVPPEIEALAATFQRDALRLRTASETRQHADIDYRCFSVAQGDREHAIINVLRYFEAERAIVFCKTRAEVSHLLGRFHNRGFQVVALSGELSQTERLHALQAVRDGRARVCIATDVAARGIDLPGLELVIHADLPQNPEALLHRSGRTGRAGRHGVSALIVTPRDTKKAQRLLQAAKLRAEWGPAPSVEAVLEKDESRLLAAPELAGEVAEDEAASVAALTKAHGSEALAAAFLRLWRAGRSAPEEIATIAAPAAPAPAVKRDLQAFGDSVWYALSVGHEGRAEARWILPKLCDHGRITRAAIGAIRVQRNVTFVQIAAGEAAGFEAALGAGLEIEAGLSLSRLESAPSFDRSEPAPRGRPQRPERPARAERPQRSERPARPERLERSEPALQEHDAPAEAPRKKPRWSPEKKAERPAREHRAEGHAEHRSEASAAAPSEGRTGWKKPRTTEPGKKPRGKHAPGGKPFGGKPAGGKAGGFKAGSARAGAGGKPRSGPKGKRP
ncbi:DEAD/DEAH box helicase [Solirhodobacter olei]|uniref:DEAD/DEAH box helicase n=1 Tax=Solirhodobacter olei TaxID=2493082 RepID=UPI000FDC338F|nr:DEAD/DEAH box helicase [Solirhodobacter olei]